VSGPGSLAVTWQFGDGTEQVASSVNHTFALGWYTVVVTASDSWGDSAVDAFATEAGTSLDLSASLSTTSGPPPLTVSFAANASGGVGPPYWYSWTFGSNGSARGSNGTYTFARDGTYTVTATVTDLLGEWSTMNWTITVGPAPSPLVPVLLLVTSAGVGVLLAVIAVVRYRRVRPTTVSP
jgi:PKD repeat protein